MLGNVSEICLDITGYGSYLAYFKESLTDGWNDQENPAVTVDPYGPKNFTYYRNMYRGGNWQNEWSSLGTYKRDTGVKPDYTISSAGGSIGVRLFCSVKEAVK
jgi:hypothetical protein